MHSLYHIYIYSICDNANAWKYNATNTQRLLSDLDRYCLFSKLRQRAKLMADFECVQTHLTEQYLSYYVS